MPRELYEAAEIDGADGVQKLRYITLPMIRQTIVIVMLLVITGCFKLINPISGSRINTHIRPTKIGLIILGEKHNDFLVITGCFKIFETVYQLTNGGPNHLSETLVTYMYYSTFTSSRYGYGMSIAAIAFLFSAVFAVLYIYFARENVGGDME